MPKVTLPELQTLAANGNAEAMYALSQYHFSRGEQQKTVELLESAHSLGHVQASFTLAQMYASEPGIQDFARALSLLQTENLNALPAAQELKACVIIRAEFSQPSFDQALQGIRRAAQLGSENAELTLAILAAAVNAKNTQRLSNCALNKNNELASALLTRLHVVQAQSDVFQNEHELSVEPPIELSQIFGINVSGVSTTTRLHSTPVTSLAHFMPAIFCEYIQIKWGGKTSPSQVIDPVTGEKRLDPIRRSSSYAIDPFEEDFLLTLIKSAMAHSAGSSYTHGEYLALLQYKPKEEYRYHCDFLVTTNNEPLPTVERSGQRRSTVLVYLNDNFTGGETDFPKWRTCIAPSCGSAVIFNNLDDNGKPNFDSVHCGKPVVSGEKWLLSLWLREKAFAH